MCCAPLAYQLSRVVTERWIATRGTQCIAINNCSYVAGLYVNANKCNHVSNVLSLCFVFMIPDRVPWYGHIHGTVWAASASASLLIFFHCKTARFVSFSFVLHHSRRNIFTSFCLALQDRCELASVYFSFLPSRGVAIPAATNINTAFWQRPFFDWLAVQYNAAFSITVHAQDCLVFSTVNLWTNGTSLKCI